MISMESADQARVASLKHAARRDLFVSRIEKYEAKVRQEQKAKAKQRASMVLVQQQHPVSALQLLDLAEKTIVPAGQCQSQTEMPVQGSEDFSEQKMQINVLSQRDKEDSSEQEMTSEPHEHSLQLHPSAGDFQKTNSSGLKAVIKSTEDLKLSTVTPTANWVSSDEDGHANCYKDVNVPPAVTEIDIAAIAAALKIRVKAVDMTALMQEHVFRCARGSLDSMNKLHCKVVAHALKKEFDKVYGPAWHCIVGTSFGSYVTHSLGGFVYFSMDKVSVLLFKTAVEPIDC